MSKKFFQIHKSLRRGSCCSYKHPDHFEEENKNRPPKKEITNSKELHNRYKEIYSPFKT